MEHMTLLTPANAQQIVSKVHHRQSDGEIHTQGYSFIKEWMWSEHPYTTFSDLATILQAVEADGRFVAIRGKIKPEVDTNLPILRRLHDNPENNEPATFMAHDVSFVLIDFDNIPNKWGTPTTPEEVQAVLYALICDTLPPAFHVAKFWFQFSNSMLIRHGWDLLMVHCWFLLNKPQSDVLLAQWAEANGSIDESVFRPVQVHYIGKPRFRGMDDPFGDDGRSGICETFAERDTVDFHYDMIDSTDWAHMKTEEVKETQRVWKAKGHAFTNVNYTAATTPMQRISEIGVGGRLHMPITRSAASWVVHCGLNPDRERWKELVRERIFLTPHPDQKSRLSDKYLNACWRSAQMKYSSRNPHNPPMPLECLGNPNRY